MKRLIMLILLSILSMNASCQTTEEQETTVPISWDRYDTLHENNTKVTHLRLLQVTADSTTIIKVVRDNISVADTALTLTLPSDGISRTFSMIAVSPQLDSYLSNLVTADIPIYTVPKRPTRVINLRIGGVQ